MSSRGRAVLRALTLVVVLLLAFAWVRGEITIGKTDCAVTMDRVSTSSISGSEDTPRTRFGLIGHPEAGDPHLTQMIVEETARRMDGNGVTCTIIENSGQTVVTDGFLDAVLLIDASQVSSRVLPLKRSSEGIVRIRAFPMDLSGLSSTSSLSAEVRYSVSTRGLQNARGARAKIVDQTVSLIVRAVSEKDGSAHPINGPDSRGTFTLKDFGYELTIYDENYQKQVSGEDLPAVQLSHSKSMKSLDEDDLAGLVMPSGAVKRWQIESETNGVSATVAAFAVDRTYQQLANHFSLQLDQISVDSPYAAMSSESALGTASQSLHSDELSVSVAYLGAGAGSYREVAIDEDQQEG